MAKRSRSISLDGSMPLDVAQASRFPAGSLRAVANTIRRMYCLEYRAIHPDSPKYGEARIPQWDGGADRTGAVHRPVWPVAADFMLTQGYDPISYIHAMFVNRRGQHDPTPTHIRTPAVEEAYRHYLQHVQEDLTSAWDRACTAVAGRVNMLRASYPDETDARIYATAVSDSQLDLSPLYRFCASSMLQDPALVAHYHDNALVQYAFQKAEYDRAWAEHIPASLRAEADTYRQRMAD